MDLIKITALKVTLCHCKTRNHEAYANVSDFKEDEKKIMHADQTIQQNVKLFHYRLNTTKLIEKQFHPVTGQPYQSNPVKTITSPS